MKMFPTATTQILTQYETLDCTKGGDARVCEKEIMDDQNECPMYQDVVVKRMRFMDKPFAREVAKRCQRVRKLLDVGTGPGMIPILICKANKNVNITAVDMSEGMLALAESEGIAQGVGDRISWEYADAKALPYDSASFDMVISHVMLHHLANPVPAFKEMARVLKPGGVLFLRDLLRPPRWAIPILVSLLSIPVGYTAQEKVLYEESVGAAFSLNEIRGHVAEAGLHKARIGVSLIPPSFTVEYIRSRAIEASPRQHVGH